MKGIEKRVGKMPLVVIVVVTSIFASTLAAFLFSRVFPPRADTDLNEALAALALGMNRQMPITVGSSTRLDSVAALAGPEFVYNYTITRQIPRSEMKELIARAQGQTRDHFLHDEKMAFFREHKVQLVLAYKHPDGTEVGRIVIRPDDWSSPSASTAGQQ